MGSESLLNDRTVRRALWGPGKPQLRIDVAIKVKKENVEFCSVLRDRIGGVSSSISRRGPTPSTASRSRESQRMGVLIENKIRSNGVANGSAQS
jgi:hypothetical protein